MCRLLLPVVVAAPLFATTPVAGRAQAPAAALRQALEESAAGQRGLHEGRAVTPVLDSLAMRMLFANQDADMMTRWLPDGTAVAHKTGSVNEARNDCGIMVTPAAPIALCVMMRDNDETTYCVDSGARRLIARVARVVYRHYNPDAELPALPVVDPR